MASVDRPLVLVHGLGVSPRYLRPFARAAARAGRAALVPELSVGVPVEALARELGAAMTRHGIERAPLVANSLGCQTAVELAAGEPGRVASLVLVGPTADSRARTLPRMLARLAADVPRETAAVNWVVATDYVRRGPRRALRQARWMLRHAIEERLPLVRCPLLVVRGEHDPISPERWVEEVAAAGEGTWTTVAGAAHAAHFTHPEEVLALARTYLTAT